MVQHYCYGDPIYIGDFLRGVNPTSKIVYRILMLALKQWNINIGTFIALLSLGTNENENLFKLMNFKAY